MSSSRSQAAGLTIGQDDVKLSRSLAHVLVAFGAYSILGTATRVIASSKGELMRSGSSYSEANQGREGDQGRLEEHLDW